MLINLLISLTIGLAILTPIIVIIVDVIESKEVEQGRQSFKQSIGSLDENYWREYIDK